ncbi:MAG: hypothetical protein HYU36_24435 [Planctomycetes bacterium]|nr:hypothetical protein [Planctomycetota bacterium]
MNPERTISSERAVTLRAFLMAAALTVILSLCLPYFELWFGGGRAMCGLSYPAVWALLFFIIPINWMLWAVGPRFQFSRGEILFIYSLVSISCLIPTLGLVTHLFPVLTAPGYYGPDRCPSCPEGLVLHWGRSAWPGCSCPRRCRHIPVH